ncbi:hypothetical protein QQF64_025706 [Cirrhinus molitorella]|uniref:Ig-like domain-containing protein n=1 Tax=Cirrhinus molitorella TaxID=172907 RepID=A0ABR3NPW7_9TELE
MKFICLTLLIICGITDSRAEQYAVVGPADPVFVVAGEDVILHCSVKPSISVVDMRVEWFRSDLKDSQLVHLYKDHEDRNTEQSQSYRGRTKLNHQELQRGNASLKVSSVQISDEGLYKCFIQSKSWYDDTTVSVSVEAVGRPPVITVDGFDHSGGLHLLCESEGWYPEPVLEWLNSEGVSLSPETTEKHRNTDGFSVKHTITVHHRNDKIHCRVKLRHHELETMIITTTESIISVVLKRGYAYPWGPTRRNRAEQQAGDSTDDQQSRLQRRGESISRQLNSSIKEMRRRKNQTQPVERIGRSPRGESSEPGQSELERREQRSRDPGGEVGLG